MSPARPRVTLVPVGGTIESAPPDPLQLAGYVELGVLLQPGELLAGVAPELARFADVEEVPFRRLGPRLSRVPPRERPPVSRDR